MIGRTLCNLLVVGSLIAACGNHSSTNDPDVPSTDYDRDCRIRFGIVSNETALDYDRATREWVRRHFPKDPHEPVA